MVKVELKVKLQAWNEGCTRIEMEWPDSETICEPSGHGEMRSL